MNSFKNEFRKIFNETITYYPDFLVNLAVNILLFFIIFRFNEKKGSITSFVLWILVSGVMSEASITISTEKQLGTLQNLLLKPVSILQTIINKTLSWIIINTVKLLLTLFALSFFYNVSEIFDLRIFFVFIISLIGVFGFSLILGALTLMYTKAASFETILSYLMLYFSGAFIPVSKFVVYTNPLSNATFIIKNISVVGVKDYFVLVLISLIWFGIGCLLFESIFKKSKNFNWSY